MDAGWTPSWGVWWGVGGLKALQPQPPGWQLSHLATDGPPARGHRDAQGPPSHCPRDHLAAGALKPDLEDTA